MTEEEAKTKWCPMVRLMWRQNGGAANCWVQESPEGTLSIVRAPADAACIGSACMMWRWNTRYIPPANQYMQWTPPPEGKTEVSATEGHCGLAGK